MNTETIIIPECKRLHIVYHRGPYRVSAHQHGKQYTAVVSTNPPDQPRESRELFNKHVVTFTAPTLQHLLDTLMAWEMDSIPAREDAS
jgi:hypothetical protein